MPSSPSTCWYNDTHALHEITSLHCTLHAHQCKSQLGSDLLVQRRPDAACLVFTGENCSAFTFNNLQELYRLAAYLRMHQLTKKMREYCLYGTSPTAPYSYTERMLACIILRCARQAVGGEEELLPAAILAYVRMNKGLPCLCRWPLMYDKDVWDRMMDAAGEVCHHWLAHVLPLYAIRFPGEVGNITKFILKVKSLQLPEAAAKTVGTCLKDSDLRSCVSSNELGVLAILPGTCVPHVRSLQGTYKKRFGIDLAAALRKYAACGLGPADRVGAWILPWTHMLAACVQLQCTIKVSPVILARRLRFHCTPVLYSGASTACDCSVISLS